MWRSCSSISFDFWCFVYYICVMNEEQSQIVTRLGYSLFQHKKIPLFGCWQLRVCETRILHSTYNLQVIELAFDIHFHFRCQLELYRFFLQTKDYWKSFGANFVNNLVPSRSLVFLKWTAEAWFSQRLQPSSYWTVINSFVALWGLLKCRQRGLSWVLVSRYLNRWHWQRL